MAAREARPCLLGTYALTAEWHALADPGAEPSAVRLKLAWWREELERAASAAPLHPITRFLTSLAPTAITDLAPLSSTLEAAAAQLAGAPLERAGELATHADALYGVPLRVAARLAGVRDQGYEVHACTTALAAGEYLARAIADYGREARMGRIPFAIDELLAAGIDNDDLAAGEPPQRLQTYLDDLRRRAAAHFASAAVALPPDQRPKLRHLCVLSVLGAKRLKGRERRSGADFGLGDLYDAWNAARRAAAAR